MVDSSAEVEDLESFAARARRWAIGNLPEEGDDSLSDREVQALLFDSGFAGLAFPAAYGGAGLTLQHQKVFFDRAAVGRRVPTTLNVSIAMLGATLVDHASETLKLRHLPRMLRGDETWIQLLSEPSGGSDMAGVLTRLTRDGDSYVLQGAKMWSTGAQEADWGLCLARTDWNAPKHGGLSMIAVPLQQQLPGLVVEPIREATGAQAEFCQEYFDDVVLPADHLVGLENGGWAVAQTLLYYERLATAGAGHGYGLRKPAGEGSANATSTESLIATARTRASSQELRHLIADAYIERTVARCGNDRIMTGLRTGHYVGQWGSLLKLHLGVDVPRQAKIALAVHGADGVIWDGDAQVTAGPGEKWLGCRGSSIAGGSNEIQRNIVSERLLQLPKEPSFDRGIPFNEVLQNRAKFVDPDAGGEG